MAELFSPAILSAYMVSTPWTLKTILTLLVMRHGESSADANTTGFAFIRHEEFVQKVKFYVKYEILSSLSPHD